MRLGWVVLAATGCRSILGIDTPGDTPDAPIGVPGDGKHADAAIHDDSSIPVLPDAPPGAPALVQSAQTESSGASSVAVKLSSPVVAGDLVVVAVGVFDGSPTEMLADTLNNGWGQAVAPTSSGGISTTTWFTIVQNGGASDTITVNFGKSESFPDVRVVEYTNIASAGTIDATTGNSGTSASPSATLTTHAANDLLVASDYSSTFVTAVGNGFDEILLSSPSQNVLATRVGATAAQYTASATLETPVGWVMQLVAFRAK